MSFPAAIFFLVMVVGVVSVAVVGIARFLGDVRREINASHREEQKRLDQKSEQVAELAAAELWKDYQDQSGKPSWCAGCDLLSTQGDMVWTLNMAGQVVFRCKTCCPVPPSIEVLAELGVRQIGMELDIYSWLKAEKEWLDSQAAVWPWSSVLADTKALEAQRKKAVANPDHRGKCEACCDTMPGVRLVHYRLGSGRLDPAWLCPGCRGALAKEQTAASRRAREEARAKEEAATQVQCVLCEGMISKNVTRYARFDYEPVCFPCRGQYDGDPHRTHRELIMDSALSEIPSAVAEHVAPYLSGGPWGLAQAQERERKRWHDYNHRPDNEDKPKPVLRENNRCDCCGRNGRRNPCSDCEQAERTSNDYMMRN